MRRPDTLCLGLIVSAIIIGNVGCSPSTAPTDESQPVGAQVESPQTSAESATSNTEDHSEHPKGETHEGHTHSEQDSGHAGHGHESPQIGGEGLAQLSDADRALAEKQRVCPVSDDLLGTMGKPMKVEVKGQKVFLCCPDCQGKIKEDPDKYLAKLKAGATE